MNHGVVFFSFSCLLSLQKAINWYIIKIWSVDYLDALPIWKPVTHIDNITYICHTQFPYILYLHLAREKKWTATMFYSSVKSFFNWRMPFYVNLRTASIITKISGGMIKWATISFRVTITATGATNFRGNVKSVHPVYLKCLLQRKLPEGVCNTMITYN